MSTEVDDLTETRIKEPSLYNVVLLNDDFTPMQFVIEILMEIFHKAFVEAQALTLEIHQKGKGVAGTFTREIAEQKVHDTISIAHHHGHPLKAICQPI